MEVERHDIPAGDFITLEITMEGKRPFKDVFRALELEPGDVDKTTEPCSDQPTTTEPAT